VRILADENIPLRVVAALRDRGNDVLWVREHSPGATDRAVLETAKVQERILLTFDKDFGELAFRANLPHTAGIVLLRLSAATPELLCRRVVGALERLDDWAGLFAVVDETRIRTHGLP